MRILSLILTLSLLGISPSVLAQSKKKNNPSKKDEAKTKDKIEAEKFYKKAEEHFRLQEFEDAIEDLKKAYRLSPFPLLLFNIAQSHRSLDQYQEALYAYEDFLEKANKTKNSKQVAQAKKYIVEMKEKIEEQEEARAKEAELEAERLRLMAQTLPTENPNATSNKPTILKKWWFWAGIGGVAAGAGATIAITSSLPPRTDLGNIDILDN